MDTVIIRRVLETRKFFQEFLMGSSMLTYQDFGIQELLEGLPENTTLFQEFRDFSVLLYQELWIQYLLTGFPES